MSPTHPRKRAAAAAPKPVAAAPEGSDAARQITVPAPADPKPNKAVVAAVGTLVTVGARWALSGHLNLDDEGVIGLAGAVTTVLVYAVSNWKRLLG